MPSNNIIGEGALDQAVEQIALLGFKKALIVTDKPLAELGFASQVAKLLEAKGIESIFDDVKA